MDYHQPVLFSAVDLKLPLSPNQIVVDATLGHGGHSQLFLSKGAKVFGIDSDKSSIDLALSRLSSSIFFKNLTVINDNFSHLKTIWEQQIQKPVDLIFADLGLNQYQQTTSGRGFSFNDSKSLDMRLNPQSQTITAEFIINTASEDELFLIFSKYAQEKFSRPMAQHIIRQRQKKPIKTGLELSTHVSNFFQKKNLKTKLNPATKIFLALRIVVNSEFSRLQQFLDASLQIISPKGKVAIISFHSGEDRIVKSFIKKHHLTSEVITPTTAEINQNPLSRSAIMRIFTL